MNIDTFLINRPVEDKSLSTTLVIASAIIVIVAIGLEMFGVVKNTSMSMEFFMASCALHFGKHYVSSKGTSISKEQ